MTKPGKDGYLIGAVCGPAALARLAGIAPLSLIPWRNAPMMVSVAIALDTLAYAKRLREAGFTEQQAEGQAQALAAAMSDSLATKQDLRELEVRIDARFAELSARFDGRLAAQLADLERRMTLRLGGIMVAGIGAMSVLVRLG